MKKGKRRQKKEAVKNILEELTLKDVIEALIFYDIEHCRFPHNYIAGSDDIPRLRGLTLDDKRLILINREQGTEELRETIIHELHHIKHFRLGDLENNNRKIEAVVRAETAKTYKKLYGVAP